MKVHPSHTGDVTAAQAATSAAPAKSGTSFAGLLAKESAPTAPGTDAPTTAPAGISLRHGESMSPVAGHAYAEISGGKRDGLFVNTSHNVRHGQAFVLVHKNGREYHIYGHGKDRVVVALRRREPGATQPPASSGAAGTGGATPTVSAT
jgi:hypothetical protein